MSAPTASGMLRGAQVEGSRVSTADQPGRRGGERAIKDLPGLRETGGQEWELSRRKVPHQRGSAAVAGRGARFSATARASLP